MQKKCKKSGVLGILLFFMLFAVGFGFCATATEVQAATNGFVTVNGKTYYYVNGVKKTGWLTLNGNKYYFYNGSGVMATGWVNDSQGRKRYFYKGSGIMATGWVKDTQGRKRYFYKGSGLMATGWVENTAGNKMFFDETTGLMVTGWQILENGQKRYFSSTNGYMLTGWVANSTGNKRYFYNGSGYMATGLVNAANGSKRYFDPSTGYLTFGYVTDNVGTRYFYSKTGYMATGWVTNTAGNKRYFDPETGYYATGTVRIGDYNCEFNSKGFLISQILAVTFTRPTDERTIKNYLAGALQPVGQALYVWGGGWTDSTLKGVSPEWKEWYDYQNSYYDYNNYRDLSISTRSKGLDCSGFVGWAAYQVMQSRSGIGDGYTVVSGDIGYYYKEEGWGDIVTQADLYRTDYELHAGDVGYNSGHTWIVVGQCTDKSVVIVHSTPNAGCQIAGTPTPDNNYSSQAIELARYYMSKYPGSQKYAYHNSTANYIKNGNYLRWNRDTLADPDGYLEMTAGQILADLFS